jgi:hypothetical protein
MASGAYEPSYRIPEFCAAEKICEPLYYELRKRGKGPKEMRHGAAVRISHRARLEWQKQREAEAANDEKVRLQAARAHAQGQLAGNAAAKSPNHISEKRRAAAKAAAEATTKRYGRKRQREPMVNA